MKKKICFIMPVYPPHFGYANEFIKSYFRYEFDKQADLIFIFTNEAEAKEFTKINFAGYYIALILSENLRQKITDKKAGIINVKKFFALMQIKDEYEYSIILDSESELVKNIDLKALCDEFYEQKILYGNATISNASGIKANSRQFFKEDKKIPNDELYLWFNQPCLYKNAFLADFFTKGGFFKDEDLLRLNWASFDYYIYMYYLLLYRDFRIVDLKLTSSWGFLEHPYSKPLSEEVKQIQFAVAHPKLAPFLNQNKLFLLINVDRCKEIPKVFSETEFLKIIKEAEQRVLKIQNQLSYQIGSALVSRYKEARNNVFRFVTTGGGILIFLLKDLPRIKKEFKRRKNAKI